MIEGNTPPSASELAQFRYAFMQGPDGSLCRPGRSESANGTFTVDGMWGTCLGRFMGSGRWTVKSVTVGGEEWLDKPVTFGMGQSFRDVRVVLSDKRTELRLEVVDERGVSTREYVARIFTVDRTRRIIDSRYRQMVSPRPPDAVAAGVTWASSSRPSNPAAATGLRPADAAPVTVRGLAAGDTALRSWTT